jgi:hypothetical protein
MSRAVLGTPADEQDDLGAATRVKGEEMTTTVKPGSGWNTGYGTDPGDPARALIIGGVGEQLPAAEVNTFVESALAGPIWTASGSAWWSRRYP